MAKEDKIIIYSDGACSGNPGPGGWGAIVAFHQSVQEIGGGDRSTTNNKMELTATIEALSLVRQQVGSVVIYTDSTYVIRGITQWVWGWRKRGWVSAEGVPVANKDLWESLFALVQSRKDKIEWKYVRGHTGIPGNERCDEIAVAFSQNTIPSLYQGPAKSYRFDIGQLPPDVPLPEMKAHNKDKPKALFYLSLIGTILERHDSWADCERRVKGRSGAKFKKISSAAEEEETLKAWGLKSK